MSVWTELGVLICFKCDCVWLGSCVPNQNANKFEHDRVNECWVLYSSCGRCNVMSNQVLMEQGTKAATICYKWHLLQKMWFILLLLLLFNHSVLLIAPSNDPSSSMDTVTSALIAGVAVLGLMSLSFFILSIRLLRKSSPTSLTGMLNPSFK